jgi:hypothetical protein
MVIGTGETQRFLLMVSVLALLFFVSFGKKYTELPRLL